jgi:hypothetical protein
LVALGHVSSVPSISIEAYIVSDAPPSAPDGFQRLDVTIAGALPSELPLGDGWSVIVVVPSGSARVWLDADPTTLVGSSDLEQTPANPASPPPPRGAPRLVVRRGGAPLAAIPLAAGWLSRVWSPAGGAAALLELMPLSWTIPAGALVGAPTPRAAIALAWRTQFPSHLEET